MLIVCLNAVAGGGGGNLYPPAMYATFTEQDIRDRIKGAKISLISEQVSRQAFLWSYIFFILTNIVVDAKSHLYTQSVHDMRVHTTHGSIETPNIRQGPGHLHYMWLRGDATRLFLHV